MCRLCRTEQQMADELLTLTGDTFVRLADTLEAQPPSTWEAPSLCERWRVREVVAHMSTAARHTAEQYMAELQTDGGNIGATIDRLAARDGRLDPSVLLANLRDERLHRWTPPGGGEIGALTHAVIHGLDITTPLGLPSSAGEPALRPVLDALTAGGHTNFGIDLRGVKLTATDFSWSWGDGDDVTGQAADLALALTGRTLQPGRVVGHMPRNNAADAE